jgi:intracellular septation protein
VNEAQTPARPPWLRAVIDYAGIAAFAVAFFLTRNMLSATWALVGVSAAALVAGFVVERRIAPSPLIWALAALVFGVMTLVFHDPRIIKMKTTFIDAALGVFLLGGFALGKSPVKVLMGQALSLSEAGWRRLTWRYGAFFLVMAAANEVVWRTQPDSVWVVFRFPGLVIAALAFSATQVPGMMKDAAAMEAAVRIAEPQE